MKIALISFDNWGFNQPIADQLNAAGHEVTHIDFHKFRFEYRGLMHRAENFLRKTFLKQNLKTRFYATEVLQRLGSGYDLILTIKGDFLDPEILTEIGKRGRMLVGFFNDSCERCPKILRVAPKYDLVFSFDKTDCARHGFHFLPNFIYEPLQLAAPDRFEFDVFNISSMGKRVGLLEKLSALFREKNVRAELVVLDNKNKLAAGSALRKITTPWPLRQVNESIDRAKSLLDLQRENQIGLTFRVFESLGKQKKLLTTNPDVASYDFYDPRNIQIIDAENPHIDASFFDEPYRPVPMEILEKYTIPGWFATIEQELLKHRKWR